MASFGENLRREREMRGVTLEEISEATKISLRLLKALEAEEFSSLPSGIFTRSFIRAYTKYLGLDEEPFLAEYQLAAQPEGDIDVNRLSVTKSVPQPGSSRGTLLAVLVAAVMLAGSYLLYRYTRPGAEIQGKPMSPDRVSSGPSSVAAQSGEPNTSSMGTATSPSTGGTTSSGTPASPVAQGTPTSSPSRSWPSGATARTPAARGDLILQVAATEQAWVAVSADGKTTFQRVLSPRELKTLRAKESFDVVTGNAQGIVLTLNGETLNPLGGHNVYKKIHLTHDDLKNPAP